MLLVFKWKIHTNYSISLLLFKEIKDLSTERLGNKTSQSRVFLLKEILEYNQRVEGTSLSQTLKSVDKTMNTMQN